MTDAGHEVLDLIGQVRDLGARIWPDMWVTDLAGDADGFWFGGARFGGGVRVLVPVDLSAGAVFGFCSVVSVAKSINCEWPESDQ